MSRGQTSRGQTSRGQMSLWSNVPRSNVTAVKCPVVKCHLRSNVTCGQMSRGQMSLAVKCPAVKCPAVKCPAVKCPAVKCHLRSNVSCGQTSHRPSVVKCPLWSDVITPLRGQMSLAVYCPAVKRPRSNVPWSNETVVIGDPILNPIAAMLGSIAQWDKPNSEVYPKIILSYCCDNQL